jgi:putative hydrolase of the HAD superfamily
LFDLDSTLMNRAAGLRSWAQEFCLQRGLNREAVRWIVEADGDGLVPKEIFFERIRRRYQLTEPVAEMWAAYRRRHPELIRPYPGARAGLRRLRSEGWTVGVVTNGLADQQTTTLMRTGVAGCVDAWAISEAEGTKKPERRLFEIVADRCGVPLPKEEGWMVGDSATADIAGGQDAGLKTIWIDRAHPGHSLTVGLITLLATSPRRSISCWRKRGTGSVQTICEEDYGIPCRGLRKPTMRVSRGGCPHVFVKSSRCGIAESSGFAGCEMAA